MCEECEVKRLGAWAHAPQSPDYDPLIIEFFARYIYYNRNTCYYEPDGLLLHGHFTVIRILKRWRKKARSINLHVFLKNVS